MNSPAGPSAPAADAGTGSATRLPALDLKRLHHELADIAAATDTPAVRRERLTALLLRLVNGAGCACLQRSPTGFDLAPRVISATAEGWSEDLDAEMAKAAAQALTDDSLTLMPLPRHPAAQLLAAPIPAGAAPPDSVLVLVALVDARDAAPFAAILQLFAGLLAHTDNGAGAELDVSAIVAHGTTRAETLQAVADAIATRCPASEVFVGVDTDRGEVRLAAASAAVGFDKRSTVARHITDLMAQSKATATHATLAASDDTQTARLVRSLIEHLAADRIDIIRLNNAHGGDICILLASAAGQPAPDCHGLQAACATLPAMLALRDRGYPALPLRAWRGLAAPARRAPVLLAVAVLVIAAVWPVSDDIQADAVAQPLTRRIISAPFAGTLDRVLVRPGDPVRQGELLATIDGSELELERDGFSAERDRARQRAVAARARNEPAAAAQAELEMAKLEAQLALVATRLQQLELRAPIGGTVLAGDLEKEQGRRLDTGQALFEIGPLSRMRVELHIPAADIARVRPDAAVSLRFSGLRKQPLTTTLERLRPRAEIVDKERIFIGETSLDNDTQLLRPGINGSAVITGPRTTLLWRFLRRPAEALRTWLPW